jgi:ribosome-associated protein
VLVVNSRVCIPLAELAFHFVRSSGAGGQNVNKVASKAVLHFDVAHSPSVPDDVRRRFLARYATRINSAGELVLTSQRYRDQARNVTDCLEKLRELLLSVADPPKPRRPTKPGKGARERRLGNKRRQSERKSQRGRVRDD